jgi:hypothetical protein
MDNGDTVRALRFGQRFSNCRLKIALVRGLDEVCQYLCVRFRTELVPSRDQALLQGLVILDDAVMDQINVP